MLTINLNGQQQTSASSFANDKRLHTLTAGLRHMLKNEFLSHGYRQTVVMQEDVYDINPKVLCKVGQPKQS